MAAYRFAYEASQPVAKVKAQKKPAYLDFIRGLPCVVTARSGVEAAHVSFANLAKGHTGRGKGTKAHDRWVLPLSPGTPQAAQHERAGILAFGRH